MALARRIIVVGLGSIGRRHARLLNARGDLAVELSEPEPANLDLAYAEAGPASLEAGPIRPREPPPVQSRGTGPSLRIRG